MSRRAWWTTRAGTVMSSRRSVHVTQHPAVRQLGQPPLYRLVQAEPPLGDQGEGRGSRDRFGRRRDPEQRVPPGWEAADRQRADRLDVHLLEAAYGLVHG